MSAAVEERSGTPVAGLREIEPIEVPAPAPAPAASGAVAPDDRAIAQQMRAERRFWHTTLVGALIGMVVCAGLWMLIVAIALVGAGWSLGPPLLMAAGIGVFAGAFLGGWAGAMAGTAGLERAEREPAGPRHA